LVLMALEHWAARAAPGEDRAGGQGHLDGVQGGRGSYGDRGGASSQGGPCRGGGDGGSPGRGSGGRHPRTALGGGSVPGSGGADRVRAGVRDLYIERVGRASGLVEGYAAARDETAAAWANTPQGKAAYQLAQAGSIDTLTRCDLPGWRIEQGGRYPDQAPGGKLYGWRLKPEPHDKAQPQQRSSSVH
jgi:hypothetical protein